MIYTYMRAQMKLQFGFILYDDFILYQGVWWSRVENRQRRSEDIQLPSMWLEQDVSSNEGFAHVMNL